MVSDSKKNQTIINVFSTEIEVIRASIKKMVSMNDAFVLANPKEKTVFIKDNIKALLLSLDALKTEADKEIWTNLIKLYVPTHDNNALEGGGQ